ncbi:MAG: type II secretion system F family protein [Actinobacteria bacterium]|nr:type II secretion system F family protein [Actinomycetota bacterium]
MNPALPGLALMACIAVAVRGLLMVRDRGAIARLEQHVEAEKSDEPSILGRLIVGLNERLAPRMLALLGRRRVEEIRHRIDSAGRPGGLTVERYAGRKATLFVLMTSAGVLLLVSTGTVIPLLTLSIYGWIATDISLSSTARRRQQAIDRALPDFLDVVAVSVSAGVSFRPALRRVAESLGGPMGEEAIMALRQMELGASRREAFLALRERNQSTFVAQFVTALLQAEELGVPLADSLVDISREMRREAYQRGRREAARAAPRVSLIVSMLIVPAAMILIITALFVGSDLGLADLI